METRLGEITPRLKVEPGTWYEIEAYEHSAVTERESEQYGPVYEIEVLHKGEAYKLMGGSNLIDSLLPHVRNAENMVRLNVMKEWEEDPETGEKSIKWFVEAL